MGRRNFHGPRVIEKGLAWQGSAVAGWRLGEDTSKVTEWKGQILEKASKGAPRALVRHKATVEQRVAQTRRRRGSGHRASNYQQTTCPELRSKQSWATGADQQRPDRFWQSADRPLGGTREVIYLRQAAL